MNARPTDMTAVPIPIGVGAGQVVDRATMAKIERCKYCPCRETAGLCSVLGSQVFSSPDFQSLSQKAQFLPANKVIYRQGELQDHCFNLVSGWVALHRDLSDGRRQITGFLLVGSLFGFEPLNVPSSEGATALSDVVLCAMPKARLADLRRQYPDLNEQLISMLSRSRHLAIDSIAALGQGTAIERIARLCWQLTVCARRREDIAPETRVSVPLTQLHMAEATGLTVIHVNRILRRLREDGVATVRRDGITVHRPDRLRTLANTNDDVAAIWTGARDAGGPNRAGAEACG